MRRRSSDGLSPFTVALQFLSSWLVLQNAVIFHWPTLLCCASSGAVASCMRNNLPTEQILTSALCSLAL